MARADLKELASRLREHPQFLPAATRCTEEFIAWRMRLGVLNKVISTLARERILEHLLYLHFARDPADPGATFERLAALSDRHDRIGARAVRTTLRLAQIAGHVILTRSLKDGRLRLYEPAEPLLAQAGEFYFIMLSVLEELAPEFRARDRLRGEPGFLRAMIGRIGRAYLAYDFQAGAEPDGYSRALRLEGARPILASVVDCYLTQREPPSALELSRRFHVSPSQTRAVFKTVEAHGLVRLAGRGRLLDAEPLTEAYLDALCRSLAFFALNALETPFDAFSAGPGENRT